MARAVNPRKIYCSLLRRLGMIEFQKSSTLPLVRVAAVAKLVKPYAIDRRIRMPDQNGHVSPSVRGDPKAPEGMIPVYGKA